MSSKSGGPRAGCAVRKWVWCACPAFAVACGVAQLARGPDYRRMVSASDRQWRAASCHPDMGSCQRRVASSGTSWPCVDDPGAPEQLTLRQTPSPHPQGGPPQARFHPHPDSRPALAGHKGRGFVRWLAWPILRLGIPLEIPFRLILLPAEPAGAPPPPSSRRTLRQTPGGLPPAWTGTLTIHPVTGALE